MSAAVPPPDDDDAETRMLNEAYALLQVELRRGIADYVHLSAVPIYVPGEPKAIRTDGNRIAEILNMLSTELGHWCRLLKNAGVSADRLQLLLAQGYERGYQSRVPRVLPLPEDPEDAHLEALVREPVKYPTKN